MDTPLLDTDLHKYYTDKKYINIDEFIKNNLENTPLLKDITNIIMNYLNNTVPLCVLCKGKANKNVIIDFRTNLYVEKYEVWNKAQFNVCITCLLIKIPQLNQKIYDKTMYNKIKYFEKLKTYYNKNSKKYIKIFESIEDNIKFGIINISDTDLKFLYNEPNVNLNLLTINRYFELYEDKNYPKYKGIFFEC